MKAGLAFVLVCTLPLARAQEANSASAPQILEHAKDATVIVLAGEGAGRLHSIATGVIIAKNGTILTALHAIKGAAEVQVRLASGDVFDHVELLGTDERRDVAALKISAGTLPTLTPQSDSTLSAGDPVYAVTNANGLTWSATNGIISAVRPAEEVPGAGAGYRLVQFTAPIAPGSSGGALVDKAGKLVAIITGAAGNAGFAVPVQSVLGLPDSGRHVPLGSGASLHMPTNPAADAPQSSAAISDAHPAQMVQSARTVYIHSKTAFLTVDTLDRALALQKDWPKLDLTIVQDPRVADLLIEIDRPLFTYVHTFVISDKKTSVVLDSGEVTAFDGTIASTGLAKDIVKFFAAERLAKTGVK